MFKEKYLKYKEKYLKLQELEGGFNREQIELKVISKLNNYNKSKEIVEQLTKTLQSVLQKELKARNDANADREDKDLQMLLSNAKKTTAKTKHNLEKAERSMGSAAEAYRKSKKDLSEAILRNGEKEVNTSKRNLDKTKARLASYEKKLASTKEEEKLLQQKIESTIKTIKEIEVKLANDDDNLKNIENDQISSLSGDSGSPRQAAVSQEENSSSESESDSEQ